MLNEDKIENFEFVFTTKYLIASPLEVYCFIPIRFLLEKALN